MVKDNRLNRALATVARLVVGAVFLFSSFVKGVDPMGTVYKVEDYMTAWNIGSLTFEWALPLAGVLAMALIILEFVVGVMLVFNGFRRTTAWVLTAMMVFFTLTTLVDAITNKVSDCGCFGDAVKLTNWQTFWKNVALDVPTAWILLTSKMKHRRRFERDSLVAVFACVLMLIFGIYNIKNEPCIDFRPWKVGNQMINFPAEGEAPLEVKSYLTYKNKATGEVKEMDSKEFMDFYNSEPAFADNWEFVDSRVVDPYEIQADGFSMMDADGEDHAREVIGEEGYIMLATIHHLDEIDEEGIRALRVVRQHMLDNGLELVVLTSALSEEAEAFLYEHQMADLYVYYADATAIKTILRSNPGFVLLKHSKVMGKWAGRNVKDILSLEFTEE